MELTGLSSGRDSFWFRNRYYLMALGVVLLDQIVKIVVKFSMQPDQSVQVIGDVFKLHYIENPGAAFGMTIGDIFAGMGMELSPEVSKIILTLFSLAAAVAIVALLKRVWNSGTALPVFVALILGGALGNIVDRVFYGVWFLGMNTDLEASGLLHGRVVDMFYLDIWEGELWGKQLSFLPVFNIADMAISVGIGAILLFNKRLFRVVSGNNETEKTGELEGEAMGEEGGIQATEVPPEEAETEPENPPDPPSPE